MHLTMASLRVYMKVYFRICILQHIQKKADEDVVRYVQGKSNIINKVLDYLRSKGNDKISIALQKLFIERYGINDSIIFICRLSL